MSARACSIIQRSLDTAYILFVIFHYTEQGMDGEATVAAFATCPGPDCIKEVVPKYGYRVKVYNAIRSALNENYEQKVLATMLVCVVARLLSFFTGRIDP